MKRWLTKYNLLRLSALFALIAMALMLWSFFDHRPLVLVVAMSIGQAIGTGSLLLFLAVVVIELRQARVLGPTRPSGDLRSDEP